MKSVTHREETIRMDVRIHQTKMDVGITDACTAKLTQASVYI